MMCSIVTFQGVKTRCVCEPDQTLSSATTNKNGKKRSGYARLPYHPQDQRLLSVQWKGEIFIDTLLPFGLRSAPKIFSAVADALHWILSTKGIAHSLHFHYLDDYVMVTDSLEFKALIQENILISTFESLGVPLEYSKLEGPSSCMTFWGLR